LADANPIERNRPEDEVAPLPPFGKFPKKANRMSDERRPRKRSILKQKIRKSKANYIESTKSKGGYSAEGKMKLLADIKRNPAEWAFAHDEAFSIAWDAVWEEDTKYARRSDTRQLSMFVLDVFGYDLHETFADANTPGGMRKVNFRHMTARHDQGVARLHRLKTNEMIASTEWYERRAANSLVRCGGVLDTVLWNLRDDSDDDGPDAPTPVPVAPEGPQPSDGGGIALLTHHPE
jgi:hypothetical protein